MEFFSTLHQIFTQSLAWPIAGGLIVFLILGYTGAPLALWSSVILLVLLGLGLPNLGLEIAAAVLLVFNIKPLRQGLVTSGIMKLMKGFMPKVSETERVALDAGVVWIEKDLFSGKPDFHSMLKIPYPELTPEEQAFLNGPVNELCRVTDDWKVWQDRELSKETWDILKKEKLFGMIIPKKYGGLEFSALCHSEVIMKLAARSTPLCVTAMVPNSLGPAELLNHYGTEAQKKKLLPKLASGEEIPCFALTEPQAGSDAGSLQSKGTLFKGEDGRLKIKLNWDKRWITLAAISTTLGLAFRLYDLENLLGKGNDLGITCALIPSNTNGVILGRRHDPLGVPFYNCPTQGKDVVVDAEECIVGGTENAGQGWKMLMESLAAGRGISLPAQSVGGSKLYVHVAGAHAAVRKQFGLPIGKFEGVEEPLARIGGLNYLMEAARKVTCGAIDLGLKPPVITAIAKYNQTELHRQLINDAMDVCGGQSISRGPRNLLAHPYIGTPIGITVEGANIMTRTLIIFGQGALRAHPFAYQEVKAVEAKDLKAFDRAFWGHIGHVVRNACRSFLLSITRGYLAASPVSGPTAQYYRKLAWTSASFAIMSDIAMGALGGTLKFREKITGRFADILSWMYLGFATLRRFEAEGRLKEDLPFVHYAMEETFHRIQVAFDGIFKNIKVPGLDWFFGGVVRAWSHINSIGETPSDRLSHKVANLIQQDTEQRTRQFEGLYMPEDENEQMRRLDTAFKMVKKAEAVEKKLRKAVKSKQIPKIKNPIELVHKAIEAGVITEMEAADMKRAHELRLEVTSVDSFSQEEYLGKSATRKQNAVA